MMFKKLCPEEANKIMAPFFELDPQKYALILSGAKFTNLQRNQQYFGTEDKPGEIYNVANQASNIWLKAGLIKNSVEPRKIISAKFLK
jgi:NitT/TauT family transport system substrate-binding protein